MKVKWYSLALFLVVVGLLAAGCGIAETTTTPADTPITTHVTRPADSYVTVSPAEAKELIDTVEDLIVIDVSPVYDDGHLPGAINFYLGANELQPAIPNLNAGRPYLVYCHSTSVAVAGAQALIDAGFPTVYLLDGNYSAWVGAGYEVRTPDEYLDVNAATAEALINTMADLVVIDVSPHYDDGHLPRAVHYYLGDGSLDTAIPGLDKAVPYLVYCHVDSVAIAGAQALIDAGFKPVYRLIGNYPGWVAAGYPVEK